MIGLSGTMKQDAIRLLADSGFIDPGWVSDRAPVVAGLPETVVGLATAMLDRPELAMLQPGPFFDPGYYVEVNDDRRASSQLPLLHFLRRGFSEGRSPHPLIDLEYVIEQARRIGIDVSTAAGLLRSLAHVDPHPLFDNEFVRSHYGVDAETARCPLEFYLTTSHRLTVNPSSMFSSRRYLDANPDVAAAGLDPLSHYVRHGEREGRSYPGWPFDRAFVNGILSTRTPPDSVTGLIDFARRYARSGVPPSPEDMGSPKTHPLLGGGADLSVHVVVGIVLYGNPDADVELALDAITREVTSLGRRGITGRHTVMLLPNDDRSSQYEQISSQSRYADANVNVLSGQGNVGFGAGHNRMMADAFDHGCTHYIGLNPDGFAMDGCFAELLRLSHRVGDAGLFEAAAFPVQHPKWFDPVTLETGWVSGAAFMVPRRTYLQVGGFSHHFHLYCEDVDWSWRVREAGLRCYVCPTAQFYHDVTPRFETPDQARRLSMLLGARTLAHIWGNPDFVAKMEETIRSEGLVPREGLPALPDVEPIRSELTDFEHGLHFAVDRYWR